MARHLVYILHIPQEQKTVRWRFRIFIFIAYIRTSPLALKSFHEMYFSYLVKIINSFDKNEKFKSYDLCTIQ